LGLALLELFSSQSLGIFSLEFIEGVVYFLPFFNLVFLLFFLVGLGGYIGFLIN